MSKFINSITKTFIKRKKYILQSKKKLMLYIILSVVFFILHVVALVLTIIYSNSSDINTILFYTYIDLNLILFSIYFIVYVIKDKRYRRLDDYINSATGDVLLSMLFKSYIDYNLFGFERDNYNASKYCYASIDKANTPGFVLFISEDRRYFNLRITNTQMSFVFLQSERKIKKINSDWTIIDREQYCGLSASEFFSKIDELYECLISQKKTFLSAF